MFRVVVWKHDFDPASSVEQFRGDTLPVVKPPREAIKQIRRVGMSRRRAGPNGIMGPTSALTSFLRVRDETL